MSVIGTLKTILQSAPVRRARLFFQNFLSTENYTGKEQIQFCTYPDRHLVLFCGLASTACAGRYDTTPSYPLLQDERTQSHHMLHNGLVPKGFPHLLICRAVTLRGDVLSNVSLPFNRHFLVQEII